MPEWTNYIRLADSFKLSIEDAVSLICQGHSCSDCLLSDIRCSELTDTPIDNEDKMRKLIAIAKLEYWLGTHYCANAGTEYADTDQFICSECGLHLQDWTQIVDAEDTTPSEYIFKYCPNCGRKILSYTDID